MCQNDCVLGPLRPFRTIGATRESREGCLPLSLPCHRGIGHGRVRSESGRAGRGRQEVRGQVLRLPKGEELHSDWPEIKTDFTYI